MKAVAALALSASILTGCAHIPDTSLHYYPSKTLINVKVTRHLGCKDGQLFSSQEVRATATGIADLTNPKVLDLKLLNSTFADTTFTAEFHEDGRLKGINASGTGKAGEMVKSVVSLVKIALPTPSLPSKDASPIGGAPPISFNLCGLIAAEKDQVATLKYELTFDPAIEESWDVPLTSESQRFRAKVTAVGVEPGPLDLRILRSKSTPPTAFTKGSGNDGISFKFPAQVTFSLRAGTDELWKDSLPVAQLGADGWLPIVRAPAFGKNTTAIELNDNGSLKKVTYGSEVGTTSAFDAASVGADYINGKSDAERAAAAEAEMKRIKAERDLLKCRIDPANC